MQIAASLQSNFQRWKTARFSLQSDAPDRVASHGDSLRPAFSVYIETWGSDFLRVSVIIEPAVTSASELIHPSSKHTPSVDFITRKQTKWLYHEMLCLENKVLCLMLYYEPTHIILDQSLLILSKTMNLFFSHLYYK
jgi:hypothetical protein